MAHHNRIRDVRDNGFGYIGNEQYFSNADARLAKLKDKDITLSFQLAPEISWPVDGRGWRIASARRGAHRY
jgi:hypothetical protein